MTSKNPSNLTTTPVLQPRLPPADMEDQSFKTKDAKENISDINVRLFLSKKIDGLENLQIVDNVLTTKYVCMMSSDCDKNAQDGLKVKKRRIQLDNDNSDDDSDFFRPREQLQAELSLKKSSLTIYLANLRTQGCAKVLKNDFLCLIDGDHNGNLKDVKKENVVLLKLLKCLNRFGAKQHLPVCFHCNSLENAQVLIDSTTKTSVVDNNKQKLLLSCSHADVAESLWDEEMSNNENLANSNCKIILNDGKQHLATSYDGNNHGLIFANLARGATKGTCLTCKSIRCNHLKSWDVELKGKVINNQESAGEGSARDKEDHEVHKEYVFEEEICEVTSKLKIKFPFDEIIQEKMRRADLSNYSHLSDLISHPSKTDTCKRGNSWSTKDPKSMGWIYSKTVRIAHSNYVPERERTIYYRKTSGNCNCKHIYDGKDDQLQIVSNGKSDTRGSARAVSFVSISLLVDFLTEFLQNGTPMRGFFKSYQAKCINKYGMKEYSLICWKTWYDACVEFLGGVVTINEKECFTCVSCGPRPKALVVDGVQMGIQTSKLTEGEFTKVAKNSSKIEFKGSNYRDRMFIKLPANRNILREAAKKGAWPKYEKLVNPTKSAQDHDPGMELFWKLVSDLDQNQTAKPSRGLILLMSNLSTSSSTVGLMQTINTALIKDLMTFLQGGKSFLKGFEMIAVHKEMKTDYPVLMDILLNLCDTKGNISLPIRSVFCCTCALISCILWPQFDIYFTFQVLPCFLGRTHCRLL